MTDKLAAIQTQLAAQAERDRVAAEAAARAHPAVPRTRPGNAEPLRVVSLETIAMRSIEWNEKPLWQRSAFQLLAGAKGCGKGTYLAHLAAKVTTGLLNGGPRNIVFISSEDSATIDLKPRLVAAGADISRCFIVNRHVRLPDDIDALARIVRGVGGAGILVIDPVANHIGDRSSNQDAEVREAIAPLNQLADDLDCLVLGVRHPGKDRSRGAVASILGSTAWVDTPRAVVMIATDDEDEAIRHIQVVAGNRSATRGGVMFRTEGVTLDGLAEEITRAVEMGASAKDLDELLARPASNGGSKSRRARELVLDMLEASPTLAMESDTLDAAVARDLGIAAKTVKNIRSELRKQGLVRVFPELSEAGQPKVWMVSRTGAPRP
jgi:hypothetical protein